MADDVADTVIKLLREKYQRYFTKCYLLNYEFKIRDGEIIPFDCNGCSVEGIKIIADRDNT